MLGLSKRKPKTKLRRFGACLSLGEGDVVKSLDDANEEGSAETKRYRDEVEKVIVDDNGIMASWKVATESQHVLCDGNIDEDDEITSKYDKERPGKYFHPDETKKGDISSSNVSVDLNKLNDNNIDEGSESSISVKETFETRFSLNNGSVSGTTLSSEGKRIKFSSVETKYYEVALGDHSDCKDGGPALSLGWNVCDSSISSLECSEEKKRIKRSKRFGMNGSAHKFEKMPTPDRILRLKEAGFSDDDIESSMKKGQIATKKKRSSRSSKTGRKAPYQSNSKGFFKPIVDFFSKDFSVSKVNTSMNQMQ